MSYVVRLRHWSRTLELTLPSPFVKMAPQTWLRSKSAILSLRSLISNSGMRATHLWALRRARNRVSDEVTRRLIESGEEFIDYDLDGILPEPQDYSDDPLSIYAETLPAIRNTYAHGSSMLHSQVLGSFEVVTDLVNQLFPLPDV